MTTTKQNIAGNRITLLNGATAESNDGSRTITMVDGKFAVACGEEWGTLGDKPFRLTHTVKVIGSTIADLHRYRASLGSKRLVIVMSVPAVEAMMALAA